MGEPQIDLIQPASSTVQTTDLVERMRGYAEASRAPNTWRAYQSDLKHFEKWCARNKLQVLPAVGTVVAAYLADYAGTLSTATLQRRLYALSALHRAEGLDSPADAPEVQAVCSGIKPHRMAPTKKAATLTKVVAAMVEPLGERRIDVRDRALLLMGFAGAFRCSELVALDVADITDTEDGLRIAIHRSKADQEGVGRRHRSPLRLEPGDGPVAG